MGRTCSDIVPFLKRGLEGKLYTTLVYIDEVFCIARVKLPRKHKRLSSCEQEMLKDWDTIKGRRYSGISNYSKARQRFRQAIKKSIFVEKLNVNNQEIDFRFRTASEISEVRRIRKRKDSFSEEAPSPVGSCSSGYCSGGEEMEFDMEYQQDSKMPSVLESICHDHDFGNVMWCGYSVEVKLEASGDIKNEEPVDDPLVKEGNMIGNVNLFSENDVGMISKTLNVPETVVSFSSQEDKMHQHANNVMHDEVNLDWGELYDMYFGSNPYDQVPGQMQEVNGSDKYQLPDNENSLLSETEPILRSIDLEAFAEFDDEGDIKIDFPHTDASLIEEKDDLVEAQQSSINEGTCQAWVCTTRPIKIDMIRQLVFKQKVFQVSSMLHEKKNSLSLGNCNIIIDQGIKEELDGYFPFQAQMIEENLIVYYKMCNYL